MANERHDDTASVFEHESTLGPTAHDAEQITRGPADPNAIAAAGMHQVRQLAEAPNGSQRVDYGGLLKQRFGDPAMGGGRYGVAPDYRKLVTDKRPVTVRYRAALPSVTSFVAMRIAELTPSADRFEISENEIATTFLAEGGDQMLAKQTASDFLPPGMAGLYNFEQKDFRERLKKEQKFYAWIDHCLPPSVLQEKLSTGQMSFESVLYCVAAGYASAKLSVALDFRRLKSRPLAKEDAGTQLFWVSIYFSAGATNGAKLLAAHDSPAESTWNSRAAVPKDQPEEKAGYVGNPYWYALRRVASSEALEAQGHGEPRRP